MLTFQRLVAVRLTIVMQIIVVFLGFLHGQVVGYDLFGPSQKEGNVCRLKDGSAGVCTKLPECETLYNGLIKRKIPYSSIVRCSFIGTTEVVCCGDRKPDITNKPTTEPSNPDQVVFVHSTTPRVNIPTTETFSIPQKEGPDTSLSHYESNLRNSSHENDMRTVIVSGNEESTHQNTFPAKNSEVFSDKLTTEQRLEIDDAAQYSQEKETYQNIGPRFFIQLSSPQVLPRCNVVYYNHETTTSSPPVTVGSRFGFGLGLGIFGRRDTSATTARPISPLSSFINLVKPIKAIPIKIISSFTNPSSGGAVSGAQVNQNFQNSPAFGTVASGNTNMEPCIIDTVNGPQIISQPIINDNYLVFNGNSFQYQGLGESISSSGNPQWVPHPQQTSLPNPVNWNNQQLTSTTSKTFPAPINQQIKTTTYTPTPSNTLPWRKEVSQSITTTRRTSTTTTTTTTKPPDIDNPIWEQWTAEPLASTTTSKYLENLILDPWMQDSLKVSSSTREPPALNTQRVMPTTRQPLTVDNSQLISGSVDSLYKTSTISPILDNPILDPWMKEALLSREDRGSSSTTVKSVDQVNNAKPSIQDNPVEDSWMKEVLASASNSAKPQIKTNRTTKDILEYPPEIVTTTRSPILDNPVLDPWMKDALFAASNTSRGAAQSPSTTINRPAKNSDLSDSWMNEALASSTRSSVRDNPILDPWMKDALLGTSNQSSNTNLNTERPGINNLNPLNQPWVAEHTVEENWRSEQAQISSITTKPLNQPNKSVLDPWMQQVLEQTASSTTKSVSSGSAINPLTTGAHLASLNTSNSAHGDGFLANPSKRESSLTTTINRPNIPNTEKAEVWPPTVLEVDAVLAKPPSNNESYYPDYNEIYTSTDTSNRPDTGTDTKTPESRVSGGKAELACMKYKKDVEVSLTYHILGGTNTTLGEFPHMAALGYPSTAAGQDMEWNCGGTLISNQFIITAAHCINSNGPTLIRLGKVTIDSNLDGADPVDVGVAEVISHPRYKSSRQYDDIALIRLNNTIDFTDYVRPACLNTNTNDVPPDTTVVVTGWGSISVNLRTRSHILLKANLTTVDSVKCNASHQEYLRNRKLPQGLNEGHLCAYDPGLVRDTCEGDSGGPLQIVDRSGLSIIYGITSFGVGCATMIPAVYARVSHYVDWIESVVWP